VTWTWDLATALNDDYLAEDLAQGWGTRDEAEAWLKDVYADLVDEGVREVTLVNDGTPVYTMSLDA